MKASEILARALEIWGPNGERWIQGDLQNTDDDDKTKFCLYGGIGMAAIGQPCYTEDVIRMLEDKPNLIDEETVDAYIKVEKVIRNIVGENIVEFNDEEGRTFTEIKSVVCSALKKCLTEEEEDAHQRSASEGSSSGTTGSEHM